MEGKFFNQKPKLTLEDHDQTCGHTQHWVMRLLGTTVSLGCATCCRFPEIDERCEREAQRVYLKLYERILFDLDSISEEVEGWIH